MFYFGPVGSVIIIFKYDLVVLVIVAGVAVGPIVTMVRYVAIVVA